MFSRKSRCRNWSAWFSPTIRAMIGLAVYEIFKKQSHIFPVEWLALKYGLNIHTV